MRRLSAQPWFRRRRVGFGWRPVSWEGWATTAVTVGFAVGVLAVLRGSPARIPIVVLVLAVHAGVAHRDRRHAARRRRPDAGPDRRADRRPPAGPRPPAERAPERAAYRAAAPDPGGSGEPALSVEHLTKRFGERVAVEDVSFEVAAGEVFGFLGPNGAGKTTTVRMLATLITPTSGSALVTGLPLDPANGLEIRQRTR